MIASPSLESTTSTVMLSDLQSDPPIPSSYSPSFNNGSTTPSKHSRRIRQSSERLNADFEHNKPTTPHESRPGSSPNILPPRTLSEPLHLGELGMTWTRSRRWKPDSDATNDDGDDDNEHKDDHKRRVVGMNSFRAMPMSGSAVENAELAREQRIQYWLEDPIRCGYLRAFSQSEFNAENILFLMTVDDFRDELNVDKAVWGGETDDQASYTTIDRQLKIEVEVLKRFKDGRGAGASTLLRRASVRMVLVKGAIEIAEGSGAKLPNDNEAPNWEHIATDNQWKSTKLQKDSIVKHMKIIWDTYFGADAKYEICIDSKMRFKTVFRISHVNEYGPEVFEEATIDPLKTMRKDVLPRFLVSPYYRDLKIRLKAIGQLPLAESFSIDPPEASDLPMIDTDRVTVEYLLDLPITAVIEDLVLYQAFHSYLVSIFSTEMLLCARSIVCYEKLWSSGDLGLSVSSKHSQPSPQRPPTRPTEGVPIGALESAWNIYAYFIASGSAFEVALSARRQKQLLQSLATPTKDMFARMQVYNMMGLKDHLTRFHASTFFLDLPAKLKKLRQEADEARFLDAHKGCLPL